VITGTVGAYTLTFTAAGLTTATSASIALAAGAASQLLIARQPAAGAQSGITLAEQAAVRALDASNNAVSGVQVTAAIAGGGGTLSGTTTVTTDASGMATFSNLAINGTDGVRTLRFTSSSPSLTSSTSLTINVTSGSFTAPNILDNASFESDWSGFTDWALNPAPFGPGLSRATDYAYKGQYSARQTWTPNPNGDTGSQMLYSIGAVDRVWVRFYFRLTAPNTSIMKFVRFYDPGFTTPFGGFFLGGNGSYICPSIVCAGTDVENGATSTWIGLSDAQMIDGRWHSLEIEYWRNGDPSGYPSMAFWFDGSQVSRPDSYDVHYSGSGNNSYWLGGRLYSGERDNNHANVKLGLIEWMGTINGGDPTNPPPNGPLGNTTSGQINLDNVSVSSLGRIGP
jgi:hypothetical protein